MNPVYQNSPSDNQQNWYPNQNPNQQNGQNYPQIQQGFNAGYPGAQPGYPGAQPGYPGAQPGYPLPGYPPPSPQPGYPTSPVSPGQQYPIVAGSPNVQGFPTIPGPTNYPQAQAPGMYQGNISVAPSAPDCLNPPTAADMANLPGYEGISFDYSTPSAPPPYNPDVTAEEAEEPKQVDLPELKEDDVRDVLTTFASSKCCYGSGPAKQMEILEIKPQSSFHYTLETFTEKRETSWQFESYNGQHGIKTGIAPGPWEVSVKYPQNFHSSKQVVEVPNTTDIRPCHICMGLGRKRCDKCQGNCSVPCTWCNGKGKRMTDTVCDHCSGAGRKGCPTCNGNGHRGCTNCKEQGKLRYFIRLQVTWTNNVDDKISETTTVPIKCIRRVTGETAFEEKRARVLPIAKFFDPAVVLASKELVTKHQNSFTEERILEQRHSVRIIPISEIHYRWKNTEGLFHTYGFENQVHFPDYPAKCCCGCCSCCAIL